MNFSTNLTQGWAKPLFALLFSVAFIVFQPAKGQAPNAWINEIHYDNDGTDTEEGIEIIIENPKNFDLSLFSLQLYNGNGGGTRGALLFISEENEGVSENSFTVYQVMVPGIENGAPDGVALSYGAEVLQFLSYEGAFEATDGIAAGLTSTDIEVEEASSTPAGYSLQLSGAGNRYATFTWNEPQPHTFGDFNYDQFPELIDGPPPVTNLTSTYIAPDKVQITWTKPIGIIDEDWDGVVLFASNKGPNEVSLTTVDLASFSGGGNVFGAGTPTINGFAVARKETDEDGSFTITGLENNVNYYFLAHTFKVIDGGDNDLVSPPSNEIEATAKVSDVSSLSATSLSEKVRLTWENTMGADGVWWHEIIVVASENPIAATPVEHTYTASSSFGLGEEIATGEYVVYAGAGAKAVVDGLADETEYYFKVFVRYDQAGGTFLWSDGISISSLPKENIKLWTGAGGSANFYHAENWSPEGVPDKTNDVILDHSFINDPYEVVMDNSAELVELNSLQLNPGSGEIITFKMQSNDSEEAALVCYNELEPLFIGNKWNIGQQFSTSDGHNPGPQWQNSIS